MSWIRSVSPGQAEGPLKSLYDRIRGRSSHGGVSKVWQAMALDPAGLDAIFALYHTLMDNPAPLTKPQAEMISIVVSAVNGCAYCVSHRGPQLAKVLGNEPLARAVAMDYRTANLAARDRVLLDYAVALTCEPSERKQEDVERVIEYGFEDAAILKATEITAYYNLISRIACGLGVELEPGVEAWPFGSQK